MQRSNTLRFGGATLVGLCLCLGSLPALAAPNAREKATAEALFQQGLDLVEQKQFAPACEKFEGSQQLDPALGTMLRLADCYDRVGKTASAWAMFQEAASLARAEGQPEREHIASQRALDLGTRLSKLELRIPPERRLDGLEVKLNGTAIPPASWDSPLPVDPGPQKVELSAPGRESWAGEVNVPAGTGLETLEVPALARSPLAGEQPSSPGAGQAQATPTARGSTQRTLSYVAGALGIVGLGVGGYFGYSAYDQNQQSLDQCRKDDPNACNSRGKGLREDAKSSGTISTIATVAGGAFLAGGITLLLTAPSAAPHAESAGTKLRLQTASAGTGARLTLESTW